jgi:Domain of unknown function (DUF4864)
MMAVTTSVARLLGALLATGLLLQTATAETLSRDDRAAIRTMIGEQIDAFRQNDAALAYGYAAPQIKRLFQTPERFMEMVRQQYEPVYRPRSVTFGESIETPDGVLQRVFLTGPDGRSWIAAYLAERQSDGSWRIGGCALTVDESPKI